MLISTITTTTTTKSKKRPIIATDNFLMQWPHKPNNNILFAQTQNSQSKPNNAHGEQPAPTAF